MGEGKSGGRGAGRQVRGSSWRALEVIAGLYNEWPLQGVLVPFPIREIMSCMPYGQKKQKNNWVIAQFFLQYESPYYYRCTPDATCKSLLSFPLHVAQSVVLPLVTSISSFTYWVMGVSVHITFIEEKWHCSSPLHISSSLPCTN